MGLPIPKNCDTLVGLTSVTIGYTMTKKQDDPSRDTRDTAERQTYERPRVESVKLNKDSAEALT